MQSKSSASRCALIQRAFKFSPLVLYLCMHGAPSHAAEAASTQQLDEIAIKADKPAVPANLPATTEGITASQIAETVNSVTTAGVLQYLPSTHVRERFVGDRNGVLVLRVNSSIASAQTVVYADNLLLSNLLNNSFSTAPRWGIVSPNEIDRVDVIYGPFSALYPGNSEGGVVLISTHMPSKFEAQANLDGFTQNFKLYRTDQAYNGWHGSASVGDKIGDWSFSVAGDHLDNHGQPQTFGAATKATPAGAPAFTTVSGAYRDIDTAGAPRLITSSIGADHNVQDTGKIKLAYDFSPSVRATYTLGIFQNTTDTSVQPYLTDTAGNPVYNTTASGATRYVKFSGNPAYYTLSGTSPGYSESEHFLHGLSLKSSTNGVWDWEAVASLYDESTETSRTATNNGSLYDSGTGAVNPKGTLTVGDGTGWWNLDLRGVWRSDGHLSSRHEVSFGAHTDRYQLKSVTYNVPDWLNGNSGPLSGSSYGKTQTEAVYVQDAWKYLPDWTLVSGLRAESWKAFNGSNFGVTPYRDRTSIDFSPKLALSWQASADWLLRGSLGKAVRYPTVGEMFQVFTDSTGTRVNDPNLKPERVVSGELTVERALENGLLRVSLFQEDKHDALISQTDTTVTPTVTSIQNVDTVRTLGIETSFQLVDFGLQGFDLNGSLTYVDSTILKDSRNPGLEDTDQPRIPHKRATLVGTYRASERLSFTLAARYSGHQHNSLYNTVQQRYSDVNPDVYGAVSSYTVVDAKMLYKVDRQWTATLGVNNIGSYKYFVNPNPYPQQTVYAGLAYKY
jgi:iron complex outermembrane receptor protein